MTIAQTYCPGCGQHDPECGFASGETMCKACLHPLITCKDCGQTKERHQFHTSRGCITGKRSQCRKCRGELDHYTTLVSVGQKPGRWEPTPLYDAAQKLRHEHTTEARAEWRQALEAKRG